MSIKANDERFVKRRKTSHTSDSSTHERITTTSEISNKQSIPSSKPQVSSRTTVRSKMSSASNNTPNGTPYGGSGSKSAFLSMQVNDLIQDTVPAENFRSQSFQAILDNIVQNVNAIPQSLQLSAVEAKKMLKKQEIILPLVDADSFEEAKYRFQFLPAENVIIDDNLTVRLSTKASRQACVMAAMPATLFQDKDYLNYRAFHKRAYYIATIAAGLKNSLPHEFSICFQLLDDNPLLPVVSITTDHGNEKAQPYKILVHATLPPNVGPPAKLLPDKSCIRSAHHLPVDLSTTLVPTPSYNSTLRFVASHKQIKELLGKATQKCDAFIGGCALGQRWLEQRGLGTAIHEAGFGSLEWALLAAILLQSGGHNGRPLFSGRYTSIQLFKAMLQVLSGKNLASEPLTIDGENVQPTDDESPMLLYAPISLNILYKMSPWSYSLLRHFAQLSLAAMNSQDRDSFEETFIHKISEPLLEFDENYKTDIPSSLVEQSGGSRDLLGNLYRVLKKGLGDRVKLLHLAANSPSSWKLNKRGLHNAPLSVNIGLLIDSSVTNRLIDHGPAAEEQEQSADFRKFWGEKSELRRFRDGRITETLVWSEQVPVTYQIIRYLLLHHFVISPDSSKMILGDSDMQKQRLISSVPMSASDAFKVVNAKYQELSSRLHQLEGLPLPIRSIAPAGCALRSATLGHPLASDTANPIDLLIQFDSSARWPDSLPAIQYTKIAFLAKISDLLSEVDTACITRLGIENAEASTTGILNTSFLDVIQPSPGLGLAACVFRLRINHDRELHLLQNQINSKSLPSSKREDLGHALASHKRDYIAMPAHTAAIRNLISHFSPLANTIRLLKSWVASHNLSNHIPEPVLEIFAANTFLHPAPWSTPGTASTAFLRCLHFLARWDWASSPLVIDLSLGQDMSTAASSELETRFQAWKKLDPGMNNVAWFVGTNIDNSGTVWTQDSHPARVIASRVTALARAAIDVVNAKGTSIGKDDLYNLFTSGFSDFDFVIHLTPSVIRGGKKTKAKRGEVQYKNLVIQEEIDVEKIGCNVVELYLQDLERIFGSSVLFFYGSGMKYIAGLWKPNVVGVKEWRVRIGHSTIPVKNTKQDGQKETMSIVNKEGILAEIAQLGTGVIDKLEVKE